MRAVLIGLGLAVTTAPAFAETPPPPVSVRSGVLGADQSLLQVPTAQTTCGDAQIRPTYSEDLRVETGLAAAATKAQVVLTFSIDSGGRTRDIRPAAPRSSDPDIVIVTHRPSTEAEQAALAVWRFAGGAHSDCRLTIRYAAKPIAEATKDDLLRYFAVTRTRGAARDAVAARLAGPEATCGGERRGGRRPRTISYPDNKIGQRPPPGGRAWTVLRWDLNAEGRAVQIETLGSSGDAAFDAETRRALSETVVEGGEPLQGCVYNFFRNGPALPAPAMQEREDDPLQVCPAEISERFRAEGAPESFPRAFRERGVEGWALVRFDLATWGQVGNVEVIDAQPAAVFGASGRRTIQAGRATPSLSHGVRCVVPVRYVTPKAPTENEPERDDADQD